MLLHRPVKLQHWGKHFLEIFLQKIYLITLSKMLTKTTHSQVVLFASLHKPLKSKVLLLYKGHWVLLLYRGYEKEICCYVKEQSRFNTNRKISLLSTFYRRDAWRGYGMWWWRGRRYRFMYLMNLFSFGCFSFLLESLPLSVNTGDFSFKGAVHFPHFIYLVLE